MEEAISPLHLDLHARHDRGFKIEPAHWIITIVMLVGLPLTGTIILTDQPAVAYLQFPPLTQQGHPAGFSYGVFGLFVILDMFLIGAIAFLLGRAHHQSKPTARDISHRFPIWGWLGLLFLITGWIFAWSRFGWFSFFQKHTFCLPWIGYIVLINALCIRRSGHSILTAAPWRFLLLIPGSTLFWWFFEYLNRFVQNWYYAGVSQFSDTTYALFASLAFATVLPAVLSTQQFLLTFKPFHRCGDTLNIPAPNHPRLMAVLMLILSAAGLFMLGALPNILFPLVWFAPLLLIVSTQAVTKHETVFSTVTRGDWRLIVSAAVAALICGFFWELWNSGSFARWHYTVPYVNRFHVFAMPIVGYGGYLPFGLECLLVGGFIFHLPMRRKNP